MSKKKGFTLTEILITILVLAVLAGIALPGFSNAKKKAAANQAIAYLRTIRTAEKMYYARWKTYQAFANYTDIKTDLSAEVKTADYTFDVTSTSGTAFTATATKTSTGGTITLDQDGIFDATGSEVGYAPAS
ncbi:MAG: prepilin-type N-terminal cleavage/methylation domain-containing protein [Candidatus Omnitrophota bacterium]